ncbi:DinB family protein [Paenibacillus lautus]
MQDKNTAKPPCILRNTLDFQFQIAWQMLDLHLTGLQDEEFFWRPASKGLHVYREYGIWRAEWPESEEYDIGPPSISWLTWHITYWWTMVLNHSFGNGSMTRNDIHSAGSIQEARERINDLRLRWEREAAALTDDAFLSTERTMWPFTDQPFHKLAAWLNVELMKNAAEIGYGRFLYAVNRK